GATRRVLRLNSRTCRRSSSLAICLLTWEVVTPRRCAAPVKLPASTTCTNSWMPSQRFMRSPAAEDEGMEYGRQHVATTAAWQRHKQQGGAKAPLSFTSGHHRDDREVGLTGQRLQPERFQPG